MASLLSVMDIRNYQGNMSGTKRHGLIKIYRLSTAPPQALRLQQARRLSCWDCCCAGTACRMLVVWCRLNSASAITASVDLSGTILVSVLGQSWAVFTLHNVFSACLLINM